MTEQEIRNAVLAISKLSGVKQQQLYCFRTKKLTTLGAIAITFLYIEIAQKIFENEIPQKLIKMIRGENEKTNKYRN